MLIGRKFDVNFLRRANHDVVKDAAGAHASDAAADARFIAPPLDAMPARLLARHVAVRDACPYRGAGHAEGRGPSAQRILRGVAMVFARFGML